MAYTILLVDDSPVVRHFLRSSIDANSDWKVCGEAENGAIAIEMVRELHPDVVILDLQMPVMGGLEAARRIAGIAPSTIMLMFTMHTCEQLSREAEAAGIKHVFSKSNGSAGVIASLNEFAFERTAAKSAGVLDRPCRAG